MDRELIDRLARQAAAETSALVRVEYPGTPDDLFGRFAALLAEECAKVCEEQRHNVETLTVYPPLSSAAIKAAAAIRAKFGSKHGVRVVRR